MDLRSFYLSTPPVYAPSPPADYVESARFSTTDVRLSFQDSGIRVHESIRPTPAFYHAAIHPWIHRAPEVRIHIDIGQRPYGFHHRPGGFRRF